MLNLSFPNLEAEATMDAWKDLVAISNGAACSSQTYTCSHVLSAMGLPEWRKDSALRFSWCAASVAPDWRALVAAVEPVRSRGPQRGSRGGVKSQGPQRGSRGGVEKAGGLGVS